MADFFQLRGHGIAALDRGDVDGAIDALVAAAAQTHVSEQDYVSVLHPLVDALLRRGDARSALNVLWYTSSERDGWRRALTLLPSVPSVDRARTLAAMGNLDAAANEMENAGLLVAAAILRERMNDISRARALWARLEGAARQRAGAYEGALVAFNLARCAKRCGDDRRAREALVTSVRLLEEAADHFESIGQRERAFDCFQVLVQVGREGGMFEDVLEGFVNCIRILREDHLKYFALQYFEEALDAAKERTEFSAAATLAREAAEYARTLGMPDAAARYVLVQAELWKAVAAQHVARGAPPSVAENALLAAVLAFGEIGQYAKVGALYQELAAMDIDPARQRHYARASKRYRGVRDGDIDATPRAKPPGRDTTAPDVWHVDLLEWEQQGSAVEACADILLDRKQWADLIRRKALLARLTAIAVEIRPDDASGPAIGARVRLAEQLAQLQLYAVLSPLEALFARGDKTVKLAVIRAMQQLFFKRSFVTIRAALRESDPAILEQTAQAIESLKFQYAFDPLARIFRESNQARVRTAAILALARIDTAEAAEFLLGIVEHGAPTDRASAVESLRRAHGTKFVELARRVLPSSTPDVQGALRTILQARGIAA